MGETVRVRRGATYRAPADSVSPWRSALQLLTMAWKQVSWQACWHYGRVFLACTGMVVALTAAFDMLDHPLRQVRLVEETPHVSQSDLDALTRDWAGQSFLMLDLEMVDTQIRAHLPWVSHTRIVRRWPDQLLVEVTEHEPVADLGNGRLLSRDGQVFEGTVTDSALPQLRGESAEPEELWRAYVKWNRKLQPLGLHIVSLSQEARGAWTLQTSAGWGIRLGHEDMDERLDRSLDILRAGLLARSADIDMIDARYERGAAVKWRTPRLTEQQPLS